MLCFRCYDYSSVPDLLPLKHTKKGRLSETKSIRKILIHLKVLLTIIKYYSTLWPEKYNVIMYKVSFHFGLSTYPCCSTDGNNIIRNIRKLCFIYDEQKKGKMIIKYNIILII